VQKHWIRHFIARSADPIKWHKDETVFPINKFPRHIIQSRTMADNKNSLSLIEQAKKLAAFQAVDDHVKVINCKVYEP
jgi:hypothetical protein